MEELSECICANSECPNCYKGGKNMTCFQRIMKIQFIIMIYVSWTVQNTISLVHFPPKEHFHIESFYWEDILSVFKSPLIQMITKRWAKQSWRQAVASAGGCLYHYSTPSKGKNKFKDSWCSLWSNWNGFLKSLLLLCCFVQKRRQLIS